MSKEIVALTPEDKELLVEIASSLFRYEDDIAGKWDDLFVKWRNGLKEADRAIKDFKFAVRLLLTSLRDGDFDSYFARIEEKGAEYARTKEQYENLILSFHLYEEASYPYLKSSFPDRIDAVMSTLDHLYHNVIAILARAYFKGIESDRERFVSILAHDLKNPLMSIIGYSHLISDGLAEGKLTKEKELLFVSYIAGNAKRLQSLIDGALSYGRLKSGKMPVMPLDFDIMEAGRELLTSMLPEAEKHSIKLTMAGKAPEAVEGSPSHAVIVNADRALTVRAMENYLSNAIKYAKSSVSLEIMEEDDAVLISVEDDGSGIADEQLSLIFEDYYQAKGGKPGVGLGLPSVRMIAGLHNGTAWAESEQGSGSIFYLRLPRKLKG